MTASNTFVTEHGTKYTYVTDSAGAAIARDHLLKHKVVGHDTETTGLDPHKDKVILESLSSKDHTFVIDTRNLDHLRIVAPVLENEEIFKISHNGIFDYSMVKGSIGVDTENNICLMLGERSLTAGQKFGGNSLEAVTEKYLNIKRDKTLQKSFIGHRGDFSQAQLDYTADDSHFLLNIGAKMQAQAKQDGVMRTWMTENAALPAFGDIEFYGQKIDGVAWKRVMEENFARAAEAKKGLDKEFEPVCDKDLFGEVVINYKSQPQVLYALQMLGIKVDGETIMETGKKVQRKIMEHPAIQALQMYRSATILTSMFGQSYLNAINPVTGRVHFRFNQYGTDTGRPSCRNKLNCLNIPRDKRFRQAFGTDPERMISTVDYSAAELRILADLSGDHLMIDGFNSGIDFHCYVASMIFGVEVTKTNENKKLREPTKTLNFGIAYGMSPFTLYEKLVYELGQKITLKECEELFKGYKRTFREAIHWLDSQQRLASTQFLMRNMNGRTRHWFRPNRKKIEATAMAELTKGGKLAMTEDMEDQLPLLIDQKMQAHLKAVQREGANCQIQSVNADFTKNSMARIRKEFKKRKYDSRMYNSVYDEIVMDSHKSCAEEAHELQKKIMVDEANKMLKRVPMLVEGHLAPCWTK